MLNMLKNDEPWHPNKTSITPFMFLICFGGYNLKKLPVLITIQFAAYTTLDYSSYRVKIFETLTLPR